MKKVFYRVWPVLDFILIVNNFLVFAIFCVALLTVEKINGKFCLPDLNRDGMVKCATGEFRRR